MDYFWLIDFLIPLILLYYGYIYRIKTPQFGYFTGLSVKCVKQSEERWVYAHRLGGTCYLAVGGASVLSYFVMDVVLGGNAGAFWDYPMVIIDLICIFGVLPFVQYMVKKKFPDDGSAGEPQTGEKHA